MIAALRHIRTATLDVAYEESGTPGGTPVFLLHGWPYCLLYTSPSPRDTR